MEIHRQIYCFCAPIKSSVFPGILLPDRPWWWAVRMGLRYWKGRKGGVEKKTTKNVLKRKIKRKREPRQQGNSFIVNGTAKNQKFLQLQAVPIFIFRHNQSSHIQKISFDPSLGVYFCRTVLVTYQLPLVPQGYLIYIFLYHLQDGSHSPLSPSGGAKGCAIFISGWRVPPSCETPR